MGDGLGGARLLIPQCGTGALAPPEFPNRLLPSALPNHTALGYFVGMKRLVVFLVLALALLLPQARAQQNPDDQYVAIYVLMQQADMLDNSGDLNRALAGYVEAQNRLGRFQKTFPEWNPNIVNFRLDYLAQKIAGMTAQLPAIPQGETPSPAAPVPAPYAKVVPTPLPAASVQIPSTVAASTPTTELESQLNALHEQIKQLHVDNETLQSKLKEALAAQPASVDSREVAQMRAQLRFLMKENDLLKVSLAQGRGGTAMAGVNPESLEQLKQALAEANQKLADQTTRADKLALENQTLQSRVQSLLASAGATEALREENELLKKQLAGSDLKPARSLERGNANFELARASAQIARLQSESEVDWLEKMALENRIKQLQTAAVNLLPVSAAVPRPGENEARIRELERERDNLLAKLGEANKKLRARKGGDAAAQIDTLARQVDTLHARLAVDEAQAVPYTPEELALFRQSTPQPSKDAVVGEKSIRELPNGSVSLAAEAQNYFSARQFSKAEDDYLEILRHNENNPMALANLAAIELEQNKLDDAEKHVKQALAQSPNDAYNLTVLGRIRFGQKKYDEALDALSSAAKLDPKNPAIDNYLGVTLAQKGLRAQAETVLRDAVQLDPNYGAAHNNLAVIYISQQPPLVELARWHYQKALVAGQPHNPDLEKLLDEKDAPANSQ
jgi:tetratricopeptide (TPR) repeat protein